MTSTGATNQTIYVDTSGQYYPCWCGMIHRGEYAANDWAQHQCLHNGLLARLTDPDTSQLICVGCGKVFSVEEG